MDKQLTPQQRHLMNVVQMQRHVQTEILSAVNRLFNNGAFHQQEYALKLLNTLSDTRGEQ
jgi:hypothetical protein